MTHSHIETTIDHNMWGSPPQPTPTRIDGDHIVAGNQPGRALSITRPWPDLILHHGKTVENRTWTTRYRGPLILHAAKSWDPAALVLAERIGVIDDVSWYPYEHPVGVVGVAHLVDICAAAIHGGPCGCGPWAAPGQYHWEPIPARGRLGLWTPTPELATQVATAIGVDHD